jgi:hypothetical protein
VTGIPQELFRESIESMLTGDIATAKIILRDYINAGEGVRFQVNAASR